MSKKVGVYLDAYPDPHSLASPPPFHAIRLPERHLCVQSRVVRNVWHRYICSVSSDRRVSRLRSRILYRDGPRRLGMRVVRQRDFLGRACRQLFVLQGGNLQRELVILMHRLRCREVRLQQPLNVGQAGHQFGGAVALDDHHLVRRNCIPSTVCSTNLSRLVVVSCRSWVPPRRTCWAMVRYPSIVGRRLCIHSYQTHRCWSWASKAPIASLPSNGPFLSATRLQFLIITL